MKKSVLFLSVISATSLLSSCTSEPEKQPIDTSKLEIKIDGNLVSGETASLSVTFDSKPIENDVIFTTSALPTDAKISQNLITFTNLDEVEITIDAKVVLESTVYDLSKTVYVAANTPIEGEILTSIRSLKEKGVKDSTYLVQGVVMHKKSNGSGGYEGFILKEGKHTIYVFDDTLVNELEVGQRIAIRATYDLWMTKESTETLEGLFFTGARQLKNPTLAHRYEGQFTYNFDEFEEKSIYDLANTPVDNINITSNIYKINAKITKDKPGDFVNYYFNDPKEIGNMYSYSTHNGSDYEYLDEYVDDNYRECLIMIINAQVKGPTAYYRMIPVAIGDIYAQTDKDIVEGAVIKAGDSFSKKFFVGGESTLENLTSIEEHSGLKFEYSSSDNNVAVISENKIKLTGKKGSTKITIKASLNGTSATKEVTIDVIDVPAVASMPINEIYSTKHLNDEIYIDGVVASYTWLTGLGNHAAYYVADKTGSIIVELTTEALETELNVGERVIIKGKYYIQGETEKGEQRTYFEGNRKLIDGEIIYHDNKVNELPLTIETKTISELVSFVSDANNSLVGNLYKTTCKVEFVDANYYQTIRLHDLTNDKKTLQLYSGSIHNIEFLKEYNGKTINITLGIRDSKKAGGSYRFDGFETGITIVE